MTPRDPRYLDRLSDVAAVLLLLFSMLAGTLLILSPPHRDERLDEASLFGPKIGIRAGALRFGPPPTHAADARP